MIIKHNQHIFWEIHEARKGMWAFFLDCAFQMQIGWADRLRTHGGKDSQAPKGIAALIPWIDFWTCFISGPRGHSRSEGFRHTFIDTYLSHPTKADQFTSFKEFGNQVMNLDDAHDRGVLTGERKVRTLERKLNKVCGKVCEFLVPSKKTWHWKWLHPSPLHLITTSVKTIF